MTSKSLLHIASVQPFEPVNGRDAALMRDSAWSLAGQAAERGAKLIVLPEFFNVFGLSPAAALRQSGRTASLRRRTAAFCRRNDCWLLLPLIEQRRNQRYNTAILYGPGGKVIMRYDKTHLTIAEKCDYNLTPGDSIDVVETEIGPIGIMICYDVFFPEVARILSLRGAKLILFPSLQRSDTETSCLLMTRTRAMDSTCYVVRSSYGQKQSAAYQSGTMYGCSCIVAPDGSVLANAGRHEGVAEASVDVDWTWQRNRCGGRSAQPVRDFLHEDRRPELYGPLIDEHNE